MGTPGGGVWKTTNAGTTWFPIFDQAHVASIGDLVVAPSNPNVIYVATGEQTDGNGVWKSTDAGATWTNLGIRDSPDPSLDPRGSSRCQHCLRCGRGHVHAQRSSRNLQDHRMAANPGAKFSTKTITPAPRNWISILMIPAPSSRRFAIFLPLPAKSPPKVWTRNSFAPPMRAKPGLPWAIKAFLQLHRHRVGLSVAPGTGGKRIFALDGARTVSL